MKCFLHPEAKIRKAKFLGETFFICGDERHVDDPRYPIRQMGRFWLINSKEYLVLASSNQENYLRMRRAR